jgi:hypothetical protein
LDESRFQDGEVEDVEAIKAAGYVAVILQATYGLRQDSGFPNLWPIFVGAGMPVLTYHMFYAAYSGIDQAHNHLETIAPLWQAQGARYPAFNDIEVRDGIATTIRQTRAQDWTREIRKETRPGTYCSYALWQELMGNMGLGDQLGWCAAWNPYETFTLPVGWTFQQTILRQIGVALKHSWVPAVPGMASDVDVDVCYLTLEEFYNLADATPPPPIGEPPVTALDDLKEFRRNLSVSVLELDSIIAELQATPPPATPPPPVVPPPVVPPVIPANIKDFRITDKRANAMFDTGDNGSGYPKFQIWPSDSSLTAARQQFGEGTIIKIVTPAIRGDSGVICFKIYDPNKKLKFSPLYIRKVDGTQVG